MLLPFAQPVDRKWTLKKEPDLDFIKEHPKTIDGYDKTWSGKHDKLLQDALAQLDMPVLGEKIDKHAKGIHFTINLARRSHLAFSFLFFIFILILTK